MKINKEIYNKIKKEVENDLKESKEVAIEFAEDTKDNGTANFDSTFLKLKGWNEEKVIEAIKKLWEWLKETFRKIMQPILIWIRENNEQINYLILKQKRYLKHKKRVKNRQSLYLKRIRKYGK